MIRFPLRFNFHSLALLICGTVLCLLVSCGKEPDKSADQLLQESLDAAKNGDWQTSLDKAEIVCSRESENTSGLILMSISLENLGRDDDALDTAARAAKDKNSFMAQYTYGRMLYRRSRFEQALLPLKSAFELDPSNPDALLLLEQSSSACKTLETKDYCRELLQRFPDRYMKSPFVWNELGLYYATHNNPAYAFASFKRAESFDPDSPEIQLNLAVVCEYLKHDPQAARPYYEKYLRLIANRSGMERERIEVSSHLRDMR